MTLQTRLATSTFYVPARLDIIGTALLHGVQPSISLIHIEERAHWSLVHQNIRVSHAITSAQQKDLI